MSAVSEGDSTGPRSGPFIAAVIGGQAEGERFLRRLDCCSPPDALFAAIVAAFDEHDPSQARLRGLCRAIEKALQQSLVQRVAA